DYSNFYQRTTPEIAFANSAPGQDLWRPAEILADAVTILSQNFCDGSLQDGIITATNTLSPNTVPSAARPERYGCIGQPSASLVTSYFNQGRPSASIPLEGTAPFVPNAWQRASEAESLYYRPGESGRTPIRINRFGNPMRNNLGAATQRPYDSGYVGVDTEKLRNVAAETRVNATMVSGIVPSRPDQSYGGLHNFPRFLESWETGASSQIPLRIAGSFIQLNFSNYATAPFDQDAFEVGQRPTAQELIRYYRAPARFWGYDVGLQYAPAGPLAQRFITLEPVRSEFYNEPPADDPYLRRLCEKIPNSAGRCPNP
ncbi:MAG: hypothetical protein F6K28_39135, partial [Microcoleus sp. SIO2G3]|nr:hypothetical protein [Microcoleus sp. SIO2G3]